MQVVHQGTEPLENNDAVHPPRDLSVTILLRVTHLFSLPFNSHRAKIRPYLYVMLSVFSIFFHKFVFQEHLFLMGYRTQPAYVNKPGEKARGAKGETLLPYFT